MIKRRETKVWFLKFGVKGQEGLIRHFSKCTENCASLHNFLCILPKIFVNCKYHQLPGPGPACRYTGKIAINLLFF
jgi:hypothetical protein